MKPVLWMSAALLFCFACKKSDEGNLLFNKDQFPLKVGNWWRYDVHDFYAQSTDTLLITVISKTDNGSDAEYKCSLTKHGIQVDSGYFKTTNSSIEYRGLYPLYSHFGDFLLRTPFNIGDKWSGLYLKDTLSATARVPSFKVLDKTYEPVYTLERIVTLPGYSMTQDLFVTPNVGIIYQSLDIHDGSATGQKQTFQLIDYKVD